MNLAVFERAFESNTYYKNERKIERSSFTNTNELFHLMYHHNDIKLAQEIAEKLNDKDAYSLYLSYTQEHSEETLRRCLERVLSIPIEKIKRTRGALFTYLITQHAKNKARGWD